MAALTSKQISLKYLTLISEETHQYKCKCDAVITQAKNTGWSNFLPHVKSQHEEYKKISNQSELNFSKSLHQKLPK